MSSLTPLASYNLALLPFTPTQAIESDLPVTVHLTLAALDPTAAIDDEEQPSTLRILKSTAFNSIDSDDEDEDDEDLPEDEEDADLNEDEDKIEEDDDEENDDDEDDEDDEDDLEDDDDDVEEYVVCTLSPKVQFQQTLDLTINPDEEIFFVVTGSYPIHLTGNFVEHPYDNDEDEYDSEDDSDDEYDLSPDEDEIIDGEDFDINELEDASDVEGKIEELVEEEQSKKLEAPKKSKKDNKKRQVEEVEEDEEEEKPAPKETKKQKKAKKAAEEAAAKEEKNVKFNKELEQGPTESKKPKTQTLAGGVVIEDRVIGKGPQAKNGNRVGVRYIGKLQNGSTFDKNVSGKPFSLVLGRGEVIKGWEIGLQNLAVGGERRIIIPPKLAYGSQSLPGIPKNSTLIFDVKLVTLK
ncbi:Peptidyl-prolyl cis-trans isomerase [Wickerhamomyces ciferrii]|uniref:FK506-binding protein n=1 Tax=Wickerhamomyces ciferrii (strain ATCC 14091 / BCRC 22168 / CBS 111 / JCM 3599 / NBRC 0793 / NRRL Y-1031 F-60-10) TaxID=1206466 RepID=K0KXX8_WICCF|nr:Peptidyl-prolyl cis-trans isomerase [Wickerhamomyces ciferrii]CCH45938.1 Peptidyl-prolyl cis-trans isomerase [Wickerhamomyces ciferrii]